VCLKVVTRQSRVLHRRGDVSALVFPFLCESEELRNCVLPWKKDDMKFRPNIVIPPGSIGRYKPDRYLIHLFLRDVQDARP